MKIINDLRQRVRDYNEGLKSGLFVSEIVLENEAYIVNMNSELQLFDQGVNSLGVNISDYAPYAELTIAMKQMKGQPTDRVTLHDEGDFSGSFFLQVGNENFEIKAGDFKTVDLMRKYGRQILGLTNENITQLIWDYIYPELKNTTKKYIYGKQ
jgi:hypothetical protein